MDEKTYVVRRIEGEYAYLSEADSVSGEEVFIALALLPLGVDVGDTVIYKDSQFYA